MIELMSIKTVAVITGTGIAAWTGESLLDRIGRQDLKQTLDLSLFASCLGYVAYTLYTGFNTVSGLFGLLLLL